MSNINRSSRFFVIWGTNRVSTGRSRAADRNTFVFKIVGSAPCYSDTSNINTTLNTSRYAFILIVSNRSANMCYSNILTVSNWATGNFTPWVGIYTTGKASSGCVYWNRGSSTSGTVGVGADASTGMRTKPPLASSLFYEYCKKKGFLVLWCKTIWPRFPGW